MKITTQDGKTIIAHDIELIGCEIKCIPVGDNRKKELCGVYADRIRATAIFAEMTCIGWDNNNPEYVMPEN